MAAPMVIASSMAYSTVWPRRCVRWRSKAHARRATATYNSVRPAAFAVHMQKALPDGRAFCYRFLLELLSVDAILERSAGGEFRNLGSSDLDRRTSLRVTAGARGARRNFKRTETSEGNLVTGHHALGNQVQHGRQGTISLCAGNIQAVSQGFDEFTFIHAYPRSS